MFPPARTGTSFYSANLARELTHIGNDVTVLTLDSNNTFLANTSNILKFKIYSLPTLNFKVSGWFKHFKVCSILPRNYYKVYKIVKLIRPDVILLVNHYLDIAFLAIFASLVSKTPLFCSVGTQLQSCNSFKNKILNFFDRLICGNLVFPFCTKVIAWDREILRYLDELHGSKVTNKCAIVNWGVNGNPSELLSHQHNYALHNQILGVGAVSEQRNFLSLVDAFSMVAADHPDLKLKIIGHIYLDAAVRRAEELGIADRVIFTGELPHEQVLSAIKQSDAYFVSLTAQYVGLGTASIETMLMGVPVIANIPANLLGNQTLRDMDDIILCYKLTPQHIAEKIRLLLDSEPLRKHIGQNGRTFVSNNLNWPLVAQNMQNLFANQNNAA